MITTDRRGIVAEGIAADCLRSCVDWHILGRSNANLLRLNGSFVHRRGRLRYSSRNLVDGCGCRIRLVHDGGACDVLLVDLLLASSGTTRSPEQAPKHSRRGRLLLSLTIDSASLSRDFGGSVLLPAEASEQRCTALLLDGIGSGRASCAICAQNRCVEILAGGHYRGRRTAARCGWSPSR